MKKPEVIALYLPQYHRIPENDLWWGEGFTEWTNVRKAQPLFENHFQPRVPMNKNYYDLSDPKTLMSQMELAKKYGIDGFCFYHYWFSGKRLLEKPLENMLEEKEIPIRFMLCWANEPWTRTWDGDTGSKQILISQDYGDKGEWEKHFNYLLHFFLRSEYIKKDGRPVIAIYRASDIKDREKMLIYWNELAKKNGFSKGLFIINTHRLHVDKEVPLYGDGVFDFEPYISHKLSLKSEVTSIHFGINYEKNGRKYRVYDYRKICERMIQRETFKGANHYLGFFVGWDNSPRVGERVKIIYDNNTPDAIEYYFHKQYEKSIELENDYIFINAWNEWGEGAYLEPDEKYKLGYLEAIKKGKDL